MLLTLGLLLIIAFRSTMGLRYMEPNFGLVELSQPYPIILVDFIASYIMISVMSREINVIGVVILVTYSRSVLQGSLLGPIRFLLLFLPFLHQRVLPLVSALAEVIFMFLSIFKTLRPLLMLLLVC